MARRKLQLWLSEEDIAALDRVRNRRNLTRTTFIKALIEHMDADPEWVPESVFERAAELDKERRSRD